MEFTCGVWYEGILGHYHVVETGTDTFAVRLLNCITKASPSFLPRKVTLQKRGTEWISDHHNQTFVTDLVSIIAENTFIDTLTSATNGRKQFRNSYS